MSSVNENGARRIRKQFARVERERERRKYGHEARKRILFDAEPSGRLTPAFIRIHSGNGTKDALEHHAPRSGTQRFAVAENIGPQLRKRDQRHICVIRNAASSPLEHSHEIVNRPFAASQKTHDRRV